MGKPDFRDVTLWLSAWGAQPGDIEPLHREWSRLLARLFPEGESL